MFADTTQILSTLLAPTMVAALVSLGGLWWKTRRDDAAQDKRNELEKDKAHDENNVERDRLRLDAMALTNARLEAENLRQNAELADLRQELNTLRAETRKEAAETRIELAGAYKRIEQLEASERDLIRRLAVYEHD